MAKVTHVVVDTRDGYVFNRGSDGELFSDETAQAFADGRNYDAPKRFDNDTPYGVFRLVPADEPEVMVMIVPPVELFLAALAEGMPDVPDDVLAMAAGAAMG